MFYPDVDSQTGDGIAFIPNVPVLNFRYIKINGAEVMFTVEEDLLALDVLLPESPLLVDWVATGSMAYGGFAFDDENGTTRYFAFNYDAKGFTAFRWMEFDGGISVVDELQEGMDYVNNYNNTAIQSTNGIQVIVDGTEVTFDEQHPLIVDGHIMIPIRSVFEQLGADVELHEFGIDYKVIIRAPIYEDFIIGQENMHIRSVPYVPSLPPQMINEAIMLSVDTLIEMFIRNGHYAAWDSEDLVLNLFNSNSEMNIIRVINETSDWYRARGINTVVLQDGDIVDSHMLFARPGLGFGIFYIMVDGEEFIAVNSELDSDQAAEGIFVHGRERTQFLTWRNERGPGSPIFAWTFIQIFDDEEALLKSRFPNVPNPPLHSFNPFAAALLEFNAGGVDATQYNEIWGRDWLGPSTKAITVSIDNKGTQGVLAYRIIAPDGSPVPDFRLFALHNGAISYLDVGGLYALEMHVTQEGRVVEVMSHPMAKTEYTLFGIEDGILVRLQPIYNLNNTVFWTDFEDETESILK